MLQIDLKMPKVCITKEGWHGYCPMDRIWCAQRYAPKDYVMGQIYADMDGKIPSWCPWKEANADEDSD